LTEVDWVHQEGDATWREIGVVPELADAIPAFTFRRDRGLSESDEDMDMTPMIDVVFQLLLFFMIISTFQVQKAIGFPDASDTKESKNIQLIGQVGRDHILVAIDARNQFEILHYDRQGKLARREPAERESLSDRLEEIARQEHKTAVVIQADDRAEHQSVVTVIDAATVANLSDIRIAQPVSGPGERPAETPVSPTRPAPDRPRRTIEDQ
jgi:biopolymer transport protein ExbD